MYVVGSLRYPLAVWCIIEQILFFLRFDFRSEKEGMMMSDDEAGIVRWPSVFAYFVRIKILQGGHRGCTPRLGSARLLGSEQME